MTTKRPSSTALTARSYGRSVASLLLLLVVFVLLLTQQATVVSAAWSFSDPPDHHGRCCCCLDRRRWFGWIAATVASSSSALPPMTSPAVALDELPEPVRLYTRLAPLTTKTATSNLLESTKSYHLSPEQLATRLQRDLSTGATGKGSYIISGDLSTDIFRDDCVFIDATNQVKSLEKYQNALKILFDPATSTVELLQPPRVIVEEQHDEHGGNNKDTIIRIVGRYRCRGTLKLPWTPTVSAFESDIVYTIDNSTGLITRQEQKWTKSASTALRETFTPSFFDPPPLSTRIKPSNEPEAVTKLYHMVNGRRNSDYSVEERAEIDNLIENIVLTQQPTQKFQSTLLSGQWRLVYLRPGPDGAGIDRRIPFPEFGFNDNYQIFAVDNAAANTRPTKRSAVIGSITNLGQVWGPSIFVAVSGDLVEPVTSVSPKRLQANIQGGKFCIGKYDEASSCVDLPISGEGLFDSLYLGDRLRIGQNINGGGALVVQVPID